MAMTAGQLKAILDGLDDDTEIFVAHQPSWPLEFPVDDEAWATDVDGRLYLGQSPWGGDEYLAEGISDALGW